MDIPYFGYVFDSSNPITQMVKVTVILKMMN